MPQPLDNPAGRLVSFFREVPNRGDARTIGQVLGVTADANEPFDVALRMLEIRRLVQAAKAAVQSLPAQENPDFLLQHFGEVERVVMSMTTIAFSSVRIRPSESFMTVFGIRRLSPEVMFSLDASANALHRCSPEPFVDPAQLEELVGQVRSLIGDVVNNAALTRDAKIFLVQRLREIETALLGSQITGFANLEDAVDRLMGGLLRREDAQEPGVLERINRFIRQLVQAAQGTSAIAGATSSTVQAIETITRHISE